MEDDQFKLVGANNRLEVFPSFEISTPFTPALTQRRININLGDNFSSITETVTTISPDEIPPEALALLPSTIALVDSIRLTTTTIRTDTVDAFGTVRLAGRDYPTIRERRVQSSTVELAVKAGFFPFIPLDPSTLGDDPIVDDLLGQQDTTITYFWWNNNSKEPIAEVDTDRDGGLIGMRYKRADVNTSTGGPALIQARVAIYPNPVTEYATYEVEGLQRGRYTLSVISMLGQRMTRREFTAIGNQTRLTLDVSAFPAGQYFASLRNERGRIVSTRRVLVR